MGDIDIVLLSTKHSTSVRIILLKVFLAVSIILPGSGCGGGTAGTGGFQISGELSDSSTDQPIAMVRISSQGNDNFSVTDRDGRFNFEIAPPNEELNLLIIGSGIDAVATIRDIPPTARSVFLRLAFNPQDGSVVPTVIIFDPDDSDASGREEEPTGKTAPPSFPQPFPPDAGPNPPQFTPAPSSTPTPAATATASPTPSPLPPGPTATLTPTPTSPPITPTPPPATPTAQPTSTPLPVLAPSLDPVSTLVNTPQLIISGSKGVNHSILINQIEVVGINENTTWSAAVDLSEGVNELAVSSKNAEGIESGSVSITIELDSIAPQLTAFSVDSIASDSVSFSAAFDEAVDINVDLTNLGNAAASSQPLAAHRINIGGLSEQTSYTVSITAADLAGNISVDQSNTFTTPARPPVAFDLLGSGGSDPNNIVRFVGGPDMGGGAAASKISPSGEMELYSRHSLYLTTDDGQILPQELTAVFRATFANYSIQDATSTIRWHNFGSMSSGYFEIWYEDGTGGLAISSNPAGYSDGVLVASGAVRQGTGSGFVTEYLDTGAKNGVASRLLIDITYANPDYFFNGIRTAEFSIFSIADLQNWNVVPEFALEPDGALPQLVEDPFTLNGFPDGSLQLR